MDNAALMEALIPRLYPDKGAVWPSHGVFLDLAH
jgi:hypothetical protein